MGFGVVAGVEQPLDGEPLQRCPAKGGIPLVAGDMGASEQAARSLEFVEVIDHAHGLVGEANPAHRGMKVVTKS